MNLLASVVKNGQILLGSITLSLIGCGQSDTTPTVPTEPTNTAPTISCTTFHPYSVNTETSISCSIQDDNSPDLTVTVNWADSTGTQTYNLSELPTDSSGVVLSHTYTVESHVINGNVVPYGVTITVGDDGLMSDGSYSTLLSTDRLVPLTIGAEIQVPTNNQPPLVSCSPNAQYGINDWSSIPCSVTDDITTNPLDFTNFLFDYYEGVGGLSPVIGTSNPLELTALVTWRSISNLDQNGDYIPTPVEACVTDGGVDALHNGALQGCTQFEVVVGRYGPPFGNMFTNNKTIGFNDRYATHIGGASATSFTLGTYNLPELGSVNLDITTSQAGWLSYVGFECNKNWNCSVVNNGTDANAVTSYSISATRLNSSTMSSIGDIDELVHLKFMTARVGIITYNVENVVMQDNTGAQITTPRVDTRFTLGVSN